MDYASSILIAVSGGQDSLCLVKLFVDIQKLYNLKLGIINIDHQWRQDTVINTKHLINILSSLKIRTHIYQIIPASYSESESREMRYQVLLQIAKRHSYAFIATAHSSTDQIETCLYNLMRGSDIDGLNSLVWNRSITNQIKLIRPLLNINRWEIGWFCRYFSLPVWSDTSNLCYAKDRNRIRQELVPYMQYHFQYNIENQVSRFLGHAYIDSEYIRQNSIKLYQRVKHPYFIAINYKVLVSQHPSLKRRVIQLFLLHNINSSLPYHLLNKIIFYLDTSLKFQIKYNGINIRNNIKWLYLLLND